MNGPHSQINARPTIRASLGLGIGVRAARFSVCEDSTDLPRGSRFHGVALTSAPLSVIEPRLPASLPLPQAA
jgi:hypothetical protein